jgi:hypothetical protein
MSRLPTSMKQAAPASTAAALTCSRASTMRSLMSGTIAGRQLATWPGAKPARAAKSRRAPSFVCHLRVSCIASNSTVKVSGGMGAESGVELGAGGHRSGERGGEEGQPPLVSLALQLCSSTARKAIGAKATATATAAAAVWTSAIPHLAGPTPQRADRALIQAHVLQRWLHHEQGRPCQRGDPATVAAAAQRMAHMAVLLQCRAA